MKNICSKQGRLYFRRKVGGRDFYHRLPPADDPSFALEYQRLAQPERVWEGPQAGTIAALIGEYRKGEQYRLITNKNTLRNVDIYHRMIELKDGHRTIAGCDQPLVIKMRNRFLENPGKANNWLSQFRKLMAFAVANGYRKDNPALGVKRLPTGEHEPWPDDVLNAALGVASPIMRLAIVSGLHSGARVGDVIRMQHGWHDGKIMEFRTSKAVGKQSVGVDVTIPMHPDWLAELEKVPRKSVTILYDRYGKPFREGKEGTKAIQSRLRTIMKQIGSPKYTTNGRQKLYSFHGLRKNAACHLAELGLNDGEVGAICGMTQDTVRHYTKRKRTKLIAQGAADRIQKGDVLHSKGGRRI